MKLIRKLKKLKEYNSVLITVVVFTTISLLIIFLKPLALKKFSEFKNKNQKQEKNADTKDTKTFKISSKDGNITGQVRVFKEDGLIVGEYSFILKDKLLPNGKCVDLEGTGCKDNTLDIVAQQKIKYQYVVDLIESTAKTSISSAYLYPVYCNSEKYINNPASINKIDFSCGLNNVRDWKATESFMVFNQAYLNSVDEAKNMTTLNIYDSSKNYKIITKKSGDTFTVEEQGASYSEAIKDENKVKTYEISITE